MHPWGGSEELWADAALYLARTGHQVSILKTAVDFRHPRILQLLGAGCLVEAAWLRPTVLQRLLNRALPLRWRWPDSHPQRVRMQRYFRRVQPDLVVVAQGSNFDGLPFADLCRRLELPFALLAQKAAEIFFPPWDQRAEARAAYRAARHCFFVAQRNLEVTQHQLGMVLPRASVVRNPFNVPHTSPCPPLAPATEAVYLACVARLEVLDKGQDVLLWLLSQPKWQQRPLHVSFYGAGGDQPALEEMAQLLGLAGRVTFAGQVANVAQIWATHHALVLPSRFEGLPLALVEAMLCGRPAIATDVGGTAELLLDNETGFLAAAPTVQALDDALERAWTRRAEWPAIGERAAQHARATIPPQPGAELARQLAQLAGA